MDLEPSADEVHGEKRKRAVSLQASPHDPAMLQQVGGAAGAAARLSDPVRARRLRAPRNAGGQGQAAAPKLKVEAGALDGGAGHAGRSAQEGSAHLGRHSQAYDQAKITAELRERNSGFNAGPPARAHARRRPRAPRGPAAEAEAAL